MTDQIRERIAFEIKHRFYYIDYPNGVPQYLWKDGNGDYKDMESMGLDHLKASIKRLKKDKASFLEAYRLDMNGPALTEALIPLVDNKLNELQEAFDMKKND